MDIEHPIALNTDPLLIPHVSYFENRQQTLLMREILKDFAIPGEHLLLIGNQVRSLFYYSHSTGSRKE